MCCLPDSSIADYSSLRAHDNDLSAGRTALLAVYCHRQTCSATDALEAGIAVADAAERSFQLPN